MKLDKGFLELVGPVEIRRHFDPRSKAKHEVVVVFSNLETRDAVRASAVNLAGEGNRAGIRMQVPGHLLTNFKALENLGFQMKRVKADTRRVIKFDDETLDVMMDVRVDDVWRRVCPSDAIRAKRSNPNLSKNGPQDMTLDNITDFFAPPPSHSTASP